MIPYLYDLLYILPLSLASVVFGYTYSGMEIPGTARYVPALVAAVFFVCLKQLENKGKLILSGTVLIVLTGFVLLQKSEERVEFLLNNRWALQILLLTLIAFLAGQLMITFRRARMGMTLVLAGVICFTMVQGYKPAPVGVAALLFALLLACAEEIQHQWEKSGDTDGKKHLVYIAPFLLLGFVAVAKLPAPEYPYDWHFAKVWWERAKDGFTALEELLLLEDAEDFESAIVGFSESGKISGDVNAVPKQVMEVAHNPGAGAVIYLAGKVFDTFDGREWTAKNNYDADERTLDSLETLYAIRAYDGAHPEDYMKTVTIAVRFLRFRTKYMFVPLKTLGRTLESEKLVSYEQGGNLLFSKTAGHKTSYNIRYYRLNEGHTVFEEFLEAEHADKEDVWNRVAENRYSFEELLAYRNRIYEYYLPETAVSSEMQAYLQNITADAESDFGKLKAIEKHLQELAYSDSPGALSEEIASAGEYLDYFIFENPYGYCSYFSTAFVLMARAMGIPARHVQGYRIPVGQLGTTTVTSDMAHAWPEAYLEGVGWIAFEPTPGYKSVASWKTYAQKQEEKAKAEAVQGTASSAKKPEITPGNPQKEEEEQGQKVRWYMIVVPVALGGLFFIIAVLVDNRLRRKRYEAMDDTGKLRYLCKKNIYLLRMLGLAMFPGETLSEFRIRAEEQIPRELLDFIGCYERILYKNDSGDESMRKQAEDANKKLLLLVQEEKGFLFKFFLCICGKK